MATEKIRKISVASDDFNFFYYCYKNVEKEKFKAGEYVKIKKKEDIMCIFYPRLFDDNFSFGT